MVPGALGVGYDQLLAPLRPHIVACQAEGQGLQRGGAADGCQGTGPSEADLSGQGGA